MITSIHTDSIGRSTAYPLWENFISNHSCFLLMMMDLWGVEANLRQSYVHLPCDLVRPPSAHHLHSI